MNAPLVRAENVSKKFLHEGREVEILSGIDLEIAQGEMLSIVGASGAGKSTLLHLLGTLDLPTSGRIVYEGQDITHYPSARLADFRNRSLGFVFQFHHLLPEFSALENVSMPSLIAGKKPTEIRRRAAELLALVGLGDRLESRPPQLSGGEQQRVAVARSLMNSPEVILADEPSGNLDSENAQHLHRLIRELSRSMGQTFVVVTHNESFAAQSDRVVRIADGVIRTS
jgi:lipoprotein-releasing system ATP-binding protein